MAESKQGHFIWKIGFIDLHVCFLKEHAEMKGTYWLAPLSYVLPRNHNSTVVTLNMFKSLEVHIFACVSILKSKCSHSESF